MKCFQLVTKFSVLILLFTIGSCASSGNTSQSSGSSEPMTLRQHLERNGNVTLRGQNENTRVIIRGEGSLSNPGQQPLFVVDGQKMGRNFYNVASRFGPDQIVSVEVLVGAGANMYGSQGGNGVIEITTNR